MAEIKVNVMGAKNMVRLAQRYGTVTEEAIPYLRRKIFTDVANMIESKVNAEINSKVGGRVPGWQRKSVGSGGGYAKYQPNYFILVPKRKVSGGHITQYLERGFGTRRSRMEEKLNVKRKNSEHRYVRAKGFYRAAQTPAFTQARSMISRYADEVAKELAAALGG